jgi:ParB family chromosome partitioning protein
MKSTEVVAEGTGESYKQIQRYIRLTELRPDLLEMVDNKKIKFNPAVELSYITPNEQYLLLEVMKEDDVVPSLSQAQQIKKLSQEKRCTKEALHALLAVASIKERNVVIKHEIIMQYFPAEASDAEIESLIVRLLDDYRKKHGGV